MNFSDIVGPHPEEPNPLGVHIDATDGHSDHGVPLRALNDISIQSNEFVDMMRQWLTTHHANPQSLDRDRKRREALKRQGFQDANSHFPTNESTQKGNWGEILLSEYLVSSCNSQLPVYRLRYNPNVDQSMKGNDVLAFDLDSNPVRILVGEAKFRATPTKQVVKEMVQALIKSYLDGIPISLPFIADRLFDQGNNDLGRKVDNCLMLFAEGRLQIDHVGLLVSNTKVAAHVQRNTTSNVRRLAVMSLSLKDPNEIVTRCYNGIDNKT